ncbi:DUF1254 domain-containing protein [Cupriavidus basilensis]|uniref:DUF1254 domain-containing protein n=1 Tax=Cupriavidus basilensis TaxID=68895 RepID=UPI0023E7F0D6|nr:DUF1254 domain-containing protein [Cupriavidus basilensis]MDF3888924.1 DUF1254 domain-containing protein [Cupriavidus basilensis]
MEATMTRTGTATPAHDAVRYTLPLYEMARMRAATCPRRNSAGAFAAPQPDAPVRWINHFIHTRQLLGSQHRQVVTPNNDTLYSNAWLDLSQGPLLLDVPDSADRYYVLGLLDFYTNPFGYIGTRTTGNGRGRFLLHGPRWHGDVPAGATAIACPTDAVWLLGRVLVDGEADLPAVHALQDQFRLSTLDGVPAARSFDVGMQPGEHLGDPRRYAEVVNQALRENPPPAAEAALVAGFAQSGIGADCGGSAPGDAVLARLGTAIKEVLAELAAPLPSDLGGGWTLPVEIRESFGARFAERALVARNYIGALGVEEAMYVMADRDSEGAPLDGRTGYELAFAADALPQVGAFWSLTMYDKTDCMLVDNALGRYSLGDRSPSLRYDADGSLRLHLSASPPADPAARANWLPAPAGPFYVTLRLYVPQPAHLDKTFVYPPIRPLAGAASVGEPS